MIAKRKTPIAPYVAQPDNLWTPSQAIARGYPWLFGV